MDEENNEDSENIHVNEPYEELDDENYLTLSGSSENSEIEDSSLSFHNYLVIPHANVESIDEVDTFDDVNIDLSLPGMHSYLNKDMEQLIGRTIFDTELIVELFLFWRPHVILVPGQRFPISLPPAQADIFIKAKETNRIIGFIASPIDRVNLNNCVGTTAELISIRNEETSVTAMVVGRQRFKTISVRRRSDNNLVGSVRILSENSELLGSKKHPLQNTVPLSWRKYGSSSSKYRLDYCNRHYEPLPFPLSQHDPNQSSSPVNMNHGFSFSRIFRRIRSSMSTSARPPCKTPADEEATDIVNQTPLVRLLGDPLAMMCSDQSTWLTDEQLKQSMQIITPAVDSQGRQFTFSRTDDCRNRESRLPARRDVFAATAHALGRFPSWVYEMYDTERLIGKVTKELKDWNNTWRLDHWTEEIAVQFSYWILQNLPVPDVHKIDLLERDHVVNRLQGCLDLLIRCSNFLCNNCQQLITSKQKIVCLATEGSLQTFVNPHGHLHEMLTVSGVSNVQLIGRPTEEYSWFPGYRFVVVYYRMSALREDDRMPTGTPFRMPSGGADVLSAHLVRLDNHAMSKLRLSYRLEVHCLQIGPETRQVLWSVSVLCDTQFLW